MPGESCSLSITTALVAIDGWNGKRGGRSLTRAGLVATIAWFAVTIASVAHATTYTVNTILDTSTATNCTLRDAINATNGMARSGSTCTAGPSGTDNIVFQSGITGTISLGSTLPLITDGSLTITGPTSSPGITIDGGGTMQLIEVNSGATLNLGFLTLANGSATLTNPSNGFGGGILNEGTLTVTNSTFSGNSASIDGGAIYNDFGVLTITNSTFSSNSASIDGGAIYNDFSPLTVTNSTFSGNSATFDGGAIFNEEGVITATNGTFSGNSGNSGGGAFYNEFGSITVNGTILASLSGGNCDGSIIDDGGYNISDDASCGFTIAPSGTSINSSTTLNLSALGNNGGPTLTIAIGSNSQAVEFIPIAQCVDQSSPTPQPITTDQRGYGRPDPLNANFCDAGAYEYGAVPPTTCDVTYNGNVNGKLTVSNGTTCVTGGTVTGNVTQTSGNLVLTNATIGGNLQISGTSSFSIVNSTISGNLQIQNIAAGSSSNQICGTTVNTNLQVNNNRVAIAIGTNSISCPGNTVRNNLQVNSNLAAVQIFDDKVGGNLQCQGNAPIPTGGNNTAKSLQGQCAGF